MKFIALIFTILGLSLSMASHVKVHGSGPALDIVVLTESLCPDCQAFILSSYADALQAQGLQQLVNITIVPFGNARESQGNNEWDFVCQHGENECVGNVIENCLFAHVPKPVSQDLLVCFERAIQSNSNWTEVVNACGKENNVDLTEVLACAAGPEGNELTHEAAQNTDPNHEYVPWVIVNGQHDVDAENLILNNLVAYVCSHATGSKVVPACSDKTLLTKGSYIHHRSYNAFKVEEDQRVNVTALTESLCPYCYNYITTSFATAINTKDIEKIANLNIIPFGNARVQTDGKNYTFVCQHGERECQGNKVENCALAHVADPLTAKRVIVCLEEQAFASDASWETLIDNCAEQLNVDLNSTKVCYEGPEGNVLVYKASQETDPNHQYVPWIIVNGEHNDDDENQVLDNLVKFVCDNYKGSVKIAACVGEVRLARSYADWK